MGSVTTKLKKGAFALSLATALLAGSAHAAWAKATVTGADYYANGENVSTIDVLHVGGLGQDGIYLKVEKSDGKATTTIADRLLYTLTDASKDGSTAADATRAAVVSLNIDGLDLSDGSVAYTVTAYADRAETDPLYTGTIYSVYAKLADGSEVLVGTHTSNDATLGKYAASQKLFHSESNKTYALDNTAEPTIEGTKVTYNYTAYDEASTTEGTITYVDVNGETLDTTTVYGIAQGASKDVEIPSVIVKEVVNSEGELENQYWRTVFFQDKVTLSNPGQLNYTIVCKYMGASAAANAGFYKATIKLVDQDGNLIATDTVNVTGKYTYTLPSKIYKRTSGTLATYTLNGSQTLVFDAAADGVTSGAATKTVAYTKTSVEETGVEVTFNLIDGTKKPGEEGRQLGSESTTLTSASEANAEGQILAKPKSAITVDGKVYKIAGTAEKYAYEFGSNANPVINVYYVPEDYSSESGTYAVTVNYVNFLTKKTIKSDTFTSSEDDIEDYVYRSQEKFSQDGVDYVRLDGQEEPIEHSYYSGIQTYTVYYRDVNDTLTSGTVINTIRVVYVDGTETETVIDGGTTEAAGSATQGSTTGAATTAAGANAAATGTTTSANAGQLNEDGTYSVADGAGNNSTLTNEAGVDSNTERIDDEETPLASGVEGKATSLPTWAIGTGIALAIGLAAALVFMFMKRSKKTDNEA